MFHCYLDDFTEGSIFETEGKTVSEAEILEFAFKYDPQSFHMDVEAAKEGPFGGLIASGIQTMAIGLRLLLQAQVFAPGASMGSPGMDELRWLKPVRPGDTLRMRGEVLEVKPSRSKPGRGLLRYRMTIFNQHGEDVMSMVGMQLIKRRTTDGASHDNGAA